MRRARPRPTGPGPGLAAEPRPPHARRLDLGGSAARSVIPMAIVIGLTVRQFRYVERRVTC
jgi:hypothetical protein